MNIIKRVMLVIGLLSMYQAGAATISLTGNRVGMDTVSTLSDGSEIT